MRSLRSCSPSSPVCCETKLTGKLTTLLRGHAEGRSEPFGSAQLKLWKDALEEADVAEPVDPSGGASEEAPEPKGTPKRQGPPAHLPWRRVEVPIEPALRICSVGGTDKVCIGHETSEVLDLIPSHFEVVVYDREKLACATCPEAGVVVAAPVVKPLAGAIWLKVLEAHLAQADDTGMRVLDKDTPDGSRRRHMWGILGDSKCPTCPQRAQAAAPDDLVVERDRGRLDDVDTVFDTVLAQVEHQSCRGAGVKARGGRHRGFLHRYVRHPARAAAAVESRTPGLSATPASAPALPHGRPSPSRRARRCHLAFADRRFVRAA